MASQKDYYDILGIRRDATEEEIEKAYRKLARTYHLDVNPGNKTTEGSFREISEAYKILSNKEKRERYDRLGLELPPPDSFWEDDPEEEGDGFALAGFEDVLGRYFGMGEEAAPRWPQKGIDLQCTVEIELPEAIRGTVAEVSVQREVPCPRCLGKGADPESRQKVCRKCGGAGQVQVGLPPSAFSQICPCCEGLGRVPTQICRSCSGKGRLTRKEVVSVEIPAGVDDGCRIYLKGRGEAGKNGGPRGDLVVTMKVRQHPFFQRRGDDLHIEVPLTIWEAALGAEVEVSTIDGPAILPIPPGVQSGERLFLRGKGIPSLAGSGRGDQVISLKIAAPKDLDGKSREILRELERLNPQNLRARGGRRLKP